MKVARLEFAGPLLLCVLAFDDDRQIELIAAFDAAAEVDEHRGRAEGRPAVRNLLGHVGVRERQSANAFENRMLRGGIDGHARTIACSV